jgi:hypothetical protein
MTGLEEEIAIHTAAELMKAKRVAEPHETIGLKIEVMIDGSVEEMMIDEMTGEMIKEIVWRRRRRLSNQIVNKKENLKKNDRKKLFLLIQQSKEMELTLLMAFNLINLIPIRLKIMMMIMLMKN